MVSTQSGERLIRFLKVHVPENTPQVCQIHKQAAAQGSPLLWLLYLGPPPFFTALYGENVSPSFSSPSSLSPHEGYIRFTHTWETSTNPESTLRSQRHALNGKRFNQICKTPCQKPKKKKMQICCYTIVKKISMRMK